MLEMPYRKVLRKVAMYTRVPWIQEAQPWKYPKRSLADALRIFYKIDGQCQVKNTTDTSVTIHYVCAMLILH